MKTWLGFLIEDSIIFLFGAEVGDDRGHIVVVTANVDAGGDWLEKFVEDIITKRLKRVRDRHRF